MMMMMMLPFFYESTRRRGSRRQRVTLWRLLVMPLPTWTRAMLVLFCVIHLNPGVRCVSDNARPIYQYDKNQTDISHPPYRSKTAFLQKLGFSLETTRIDPEFRWEIKNPPQAANQT